MLVASVCFWMARDARGAQPVALIYALFPIGLGCVAVGALNFHRWHSFRESMEACLAAVVNAYKLFGTMALLALFFSILRGPMLFYFLVLLVYWSVYLAFYLALSFLIALLVAWAAGAGLYGLLLGMRHAGELGPSEKVGKEKGPREVRVVV